MPSPSPSLPPPSCPAEPTEQATAPAADTAIASTAPPPLPVWSAAELRELEEAEELLREYEEWVQRQPPEDLHHQHKLTRQRCEALLQDHDLCFDTHCIVRRVMPPDVHEVQVKYFVDGVSRSVAHVGPDKFQACINAMELLMRMVKDG
eukprot:EG_transcript_40888